MSREMLSAVIFLSETDLQKALRDPAIAVSRSLGALVATAIAGVIGDVTIAGPRGLQLETIADHAGCAFVEAAREEDWLGDALAVTKAPQCLVLQASYIPGAGFIEQLRDLIGDEEKCATAFHAEPLQWYERIFPSLSPISAGVAPLELWRAAPGDFRRRMGRLKPRALHVKMHRVG